MKANKKVEYKDLDPTKRVLSTRPGFAWNPVQKYPRNLPCLCGSKQKFKKCCLPKLPAAIPAYENKKLGPKIQQIRDLRSKSKGRA